MKKLFSLLLCTAVGTFIHAQDVNFGIKAGLNLDEQAHGSSINYQNSFIPSFNAGGIVNIGFKNFILQPGLFFTVKGEDDRYKYNDINPGDGGTYLPSKTYLDYVEIPLNFLYQSMPKNGLGIHVGGGPYFAYGISETDIVSGQAYSSHTFSYKNPDIGLGAQFGVSIQKHFLVDAGFEYGLVNIDNSGAATRNEVISLSAGYLFR